MSLQAMVFTQDRELSVAFAKAAAELPIDWVLLEDAEQPLRFLTRDTFDLVLTDFAASNGRSLITQTRISEKNNSAVIFAVLEVLIDDVTHIQIGRGDLPPAFACRRRGHGQRKM